MRFILIILSIQILFGCADNKNGVTKKVTTPQTGSTNQTQKQSTDSGTVVNHSTMEETKKDPTPPPSTSATPTPSPTSSSSPGPSSSPTATPTPTPTATPNPTATPTPGPASILTAPIFGALVKDMTGNTVTGTLNISIDKTGLPQFNEIWTKQGNAFGVAMNLNGDGTPWVGHYSDGIWRLISLKDIQRQFPVDYIFGWAGTIPLAGDMNGDGVDDFVLFDTNTKNKFYVNTDRQGSINETITLSTSGNIPLIGDWDGDGKADLGVCGGTLGDTCRLRLSSTGSEITITSIVGISDSTVAWITDVNNDHIPDLVWHNSTMTYTIKFGGMVTRKTVTLSNANQSPTPVFMNAASPTVSTSDLTPMTGTLTALFKSYVNGDPATVCVQGANDVDYTWFLPKSSVWTQLSSFLNDAGGTGIPYYLSLCYNGILRWTNVKSGLYTLFKRGGLHEMFYATEDFWFPAGISPSKDIYTMEPGSGISPMGKAYSCSYVYIAPDNTRYTRTGRTYGYGSRPGAANFLQKCGKPSSININSVSCTGGSGATTQLGDCTTLKN